MKGRRNECVAVIVVEDVADAVVDAAVVRGGAILAEETIGVVIGAAIGILVRMKGAGHTERGLTMGIQ